jgi:hypothetical protein
MRINADETINPAVGAAHFFDQLIFWFGLSVAEKSFAHLGF